VNWTKITFDIGEVSRARAALVRARDASSAAGATSLALGDLTPRAFAAYNAGLSAAATASSKSGSYGRMAARLAQRIEHMQKFGYDLPSRWATAEGAAKARRRGERLARLVNDGAYLSAADVAALRQDPDAAAQYLRMLDGGALNRTIWNMDTDVRDLVSAALAGGYGTSSPDASSELRALVAAVNLATRPASPSAPALSTILERYDGHPVLGAVFATSILVNYPAASSELLGDLFGPGTTSSRPSAQSRIDPAILAAIASHAALLENVFRSNPRPAPTGNSALDDRLLEQRSAMYEMLLAGLETPTREKLDAVVASLQHHWDTGGRALDPGIADLVADDLRRYLVDLDVGSMLVEHLATYGRQPGIDRLRAPGAGTISPAELIRALDVLQQAGPTTRELIDGALVSASEASRDPGSSAGMGAGASLLAVLSTLQTRWQNEHAGDDARLTAARWRAGSTLASVMAMIPGAGIVVQGGKMVARGASAGAGGLAEGADAEARRLDVQAMSLAARDARSALILLAERMYPGDEERQQDIVSLVGVMSAGEYAPPLTYD
jgi:hypothetical protein